jgi:uncharacterized protein (DUF4415 family)
MRKGNPEPLTPELQAEADAISKIADEEIDTSEMPEVTDWSNAVRGAFYRPVKKPLSLRLDADIIDWFQREGSGYQTRMNAVLREYVEKQRGRA